MNDALKLSDGAISWQVQLAIMRKSDLIILLLILCCDVELSIVLLVANCMVSDHIWACLMSLSYFFVIMAALPRKLNLFGRLSFIIYGMEQKGCCNYFGYVRKTHFFGPLFECKWDGLSRIKLWRPSCGASG